MKLIQSYVADEYFVSTIHRKASTDEPMYYYETIVWEYNKFEKKRGDMITQVNSGITAKLALKSHFGICISFLDKALEFKPPRTEL